MSKLQAAYIALVTGLFILGASYILGTSEQSAFTFGAQISVPSAPAANYILLSTSTGNYVATTTSSLISLNNFFSTTSASYFLSQQNISGFSTTSADYWKTQNTFFSTTSATFFLSQQNLFSTTSADFHLYNRLTTTTVSCSGNTSCTSFVAFGSSPITISSTGGGGSGGGTWSTTTSQVSGTLINYPNNATDVVVVGSNATTSAEFWFDPNTLQMNVGTGGAGDSSIAMGPNVSNQWIFGYDETNKSFVIASSTALGTNNVLSISRAGVMTVSYASTTALSSVHISSDEYYGAGLDVCDGASFLQWSAGVFGCGSPTITSEFSTTSADYWKTQRDFFSTSTNDFYLTTKSFFSTSSNNYWASQTNFFSTTSATFFLSAQNLWATTSADYWKTQQNFFSTTTEDYYANSSTTIAKTYAANVFVPLQTFGNASTTQISATVASSTFYFGAGLQTCQSGNVLTFDGAGRFGCAADQTSAGGSTFSTTSNDYWQTQRSFFSTTSSAYFLSQYQGAAFSTTSADFWKTQQNFFATTSATYFLSQQNLFSTTSSSYFLQQYQGLAFSTTSANFWSTQQNFFSTTSADYWKTRRDFFSTTTADYYTNSSTTIAKTYSANTFTALQTFNSASTTALSANNFSIANALTFNGVTGTTWASFCTAITGGAGLCDGSDDGAGGAGGPPYPFTPTINWNQLTQATSGIPWFQNGLIASSTSIFANASTTQLSVFDRMFVGTSTVGNSTVTFGAPSSLWAFGRRAVNGALVIASSTDDLGLNGTPYFLMNTSGKIALQRPAPSHHLDVAGRISGQPSYSCLYPFLSQSNVTADQLGSATVPSFGCNGNMYIDVNTTSGGILAATTANMERMASGTPPLQTFSPTISVFAVNQFAFMKGMNAGSATSSNGLGIAMELTFQINSVSVSTTSVAYAWGFSDAGLGSLTTTASYSSPTNGCLVTASSTATWKLVCAKAGAQTIVDTSLATSTLATKGLLVVDQTGANLYFNNTASSSAYIPFANLPVVPLRPFLGTGLLSGSASAIGNIRYGNISVWGEDKY